MLTRSEAYLDRISSIESITITDVIALQYAVIRSIVEIPARRLTIDSDPEGVVGAARPFHAGLDLDQSSFAQHQLVLCIVIAQCVHIQTTVWYINVGTPAEFGVVVDLEQTGQIAVFRFELLVTDHTSSTSCSGRINLKVLSQPGNLEGNVAVTVCSTHRQIAVCEEMRFYCLLWVVVALYSDVDLRHTLEQRRIYAE